MTYTTLNKIRSNSPCASGWQRLLRHLNKTQSDDEPLALATILDSHGLEDAVWCLRAVDGHDREKRLFAVACARRVQHLMTDQRSIAALDVAERYANGQATDEELAAARPAARAAAGTAAWAAAVVDAKWAAARAARDAAGTAAWAAAAVDAERDAARAARDAAMYAVRAARAAAWEAARAAAWDAAWAAGAAGTAAWAAAAVDAERDAARAARDAAMYAVRAARAAARDAGDAAWAAWAAEADWQTAEFRRVFCNEEVTA